jgi:5-methylcytosine-specific restriction endonuclease McrA
MITLTRLPEPESLKTKRPKKLAAARDALAKNAEISFDGYGDPEIKEVLARGQGLKCAYCERRQEQARYRDVDHFRPKSRYWWLTWTWENLLFSCEYCNRDHKKGQFPLRGTSRRLVEEEQPPGDEQSLLLDPYDPAIDVREEITFELRHVGGRARWQPVGRTARGWATIVAFGLDRPTLLDLYSAHVERFVDPKVETFRTAVDCQGADVVRAWTRLRGSLFAPTQDFHALAHDAVSHILREEIREYQLRF